jgi:hypothetical protein
MGSFAFVYSLVKGFILGNVVLAILRYLEDWWTRQEQGKMLRSKKLILDRMEKE